MHLPNMDFKIICVQKNIWFIGFKILFVIYQNSLKVFQEKENTNVYFEYDID